MVSLEGTPSGSALQSSNANAAIAPATTLVPEAQTAATFPIETKVVTATTSVTIAATYGVTSRTATLTVQAPAGNYPSQLTITPTTLVGGTAASGTVTMNAVASGNLTVVLSSTDSTVASVPSSVTVKNNKTQATFTVTTFAVATQTPVTITASYGGVIQRVQLTVTPQQGASFEGPASFGNGAERVARCASLALTRCLMSLASPTTRQIQPTVAIEQSRYNLYTPELTLLAETETTAAKAIAWEYVFFGGEPMAQVETATGEVHWYFTDHLGTPVLTTDAAAAVDWTVQREPYGAPEPAVLNLRHQPLGLPGQEVDSSDTYNLNRWYSVHRGRYTQADPLANEPRLYLRQTNANLYQYAEGKPTTFTDRLGLQASPCCECPGRIWSYSGGSGGFGFLVGLTYAQGTYTCESKPSLTVHVKTTCVQSGFFFNFGGGYDTSAVPLGFPAAKACNAKELLDPDPDNSGFFGWKAGTGFSGHTGDKTGVFSAGVASGGGFGDQDCYSNAWSPSSERWK